MTAVGMKPPHRGHIDMIKSVVEKAKQEGASVTVFTGRKPRGPIGLEQSVPMLELFLKNEGVQLGDGPGEVEVVPVNRLPTPVLALFSTVFDLPEGAKVFVFSSSEDSGRGSSFRKSIHKKRPDIEVLDYTVDITPSLEGVGKLSATDMRQSIEDEDYETFVSFLPDNSQKDAEYIWRDILKKQKKDSENVLESMIREGLRVKVRSLLLGEKEELEEISSMAGGAVQGTVGTTERNDEMKIDRDQLIREMSLRKEIRSRLNGLFTESTKGMAPEGYREFLKEQKVRQAIRSTIPKILREEMSTQEMTDLALSFVKKTLKEHLKTVLDDFNYLEQEKIQHGFIKRIYVSLMNDYKENRNELADKEEEEVESEEEEAQEDDGTIDVQVFGPNDNLLQEVSLDEVDTLWGLDVNEVSNSVEGIEQMGWKSGGETWNKVSKQIKKIHKLVLTNLGTEQEEVANIYEEWLYKNFETHCKNAIAEKGESEEEESLEGEV